MTDDVRRGLGNGRPADEDARLERILADGMAVSAPSRAPDRLRAEIEQSLRHVRPRPRWFAMLKEPPMRHASRVVVGSPTARVAALAAATLLVALLATAALVVGSQSPSPTPPEAGAAPQPPVEYTGRGCPGPEVRARTEETLEVGDEGMVLARDRGGAWQQPHTYSDPRLQGTVHHTFEGDEYRMPGAATGSSVYAATLRIENEEGAWVSVAYGATFPDGTETDWDPGVWVGEGAYEGLIAIQVTTGQTMNCGDVRGMIFDTPPALEPYIPEPSPSR